MSLFNDEAHILRALDLHFGSPTPLIVKQAVSNPDKPRRESQLMVKRLRSLETRGFVRRMDSQKPICWCLTHKGSEALAKIDAPRPAAS